MEMEFSPMIVAIWCLILSGLVAALLYYMMRRHRCAAKAKEMLRGVPAGEDGSKPSVYRLFYWSTRQKHDIDEPYGRNDYSCRGAMEHGRDELKQSKDMYRIEMWERLESWRGTIHVEGWHGNPAHLNLKRPRRIDA